MKHFFEEGAISYAANATLNFVHAPRGPCMSRGIYVAKSPLVGRQLAIGVHVPFAEEEDELILGEVGIDDGEGYAVKREIPGGVPGIFPLVGHGNDVVVIELGPILVSAVPALFRGRRLARITGKPSEDVVVVELLRPHHPRQGLTHYVASIFGNVLRHTRTVKIVAFFLAQVEKTVETSAEIVGGWNLFVGVGR